MNRRDFLTAIAASPLIYGLRELSAQDASASPKWYAAALKVMKDQGRHGIVLVMPEKDPEQKQAGMVLWDLLDGEFPEAHEIFTGCVFICMTPAMALATGLRKEGTKNRFLLDADGKVIASDDYAMADISRTFSASFADFLYGEKRDRLRKSAEAKPPTEEVTAALRSLESEDLAVREAAGAKLREKAGEFHSILVLTRLESPAEEIRSRIKSILEEHFKQVDKEKFGARLPFGSRIPKFGEGGCGRSIELPEVPDGKAVSVECGMGKTSDERVRLFLRFLNK